MDKYLKKLLKTLCFLTATTAVAAFAFAFYVGNLLPDTFLVAKDGTLCVAGMPFLKMEMDRKDTRVSAPEGEESSYNVRLSIGGVIPVKTARAISVQRRVVTVCGTPFGIKMCAPALLYGVIGKNGVKGLLGIVGFIAFCHSFVFEADF